MAADSFWLTENTSTTLISPRLFAEFCMPHLAAYGNLIIQHGLVAVHHMCGKLNALLEMIDRLPAQANEAYTTPTVGDTTLAEGRTRMPSKALIGGTNATLWLAPVERIVQAVAADLARCPDRRRIFLTSAGVLPPPVSFEKARRAVAQLKQLERAVAQRPSRSLPPVVQLVGQSSPWIMTSWWILSWNASRSAVCSG